LLHMQFQLLVNICFPKMGDSSIYDLGQSIKLVVTNYNIVSR